MPLEEVSPLSVSQLPQKPFSGKVELVFICPRSYQSKGDKGYSVCCFCKTKDAEIDKIEDKEQDERPPFDINLAVILAGKVLGGKRLMLQVARLCISLSLLRMRCMMANYL